MPGRSGDGKGRASRENTWDQEAQRLLTAGIWPYGSKGGQEGIEVRTESSDQTDIRS